MTITMSALPRLLNCDGSLVLPRAEYASEWADAGNTEHAELAQQVLSKTLPPRLAKIAPEGARVEVKVAIDVAAGEARILGELGSRDYGELGPFEIAGQIDVLGIIGDTVVVIDWKTGYKDVDPADRNWQVWGYALAACRALGKSRAQIHIAYTNQPGQPIDSHDLDAFDLADFAERLKGLHVREARLQVEYKQGQTPTTREGNWCRYCPSKTRCPSKTALLVQLSSGGLSVLGDTQLTPDDAAKAHFEIERIDQLLKEAKSRREKYVDEVGPIPLGDGRYFGRKPQNGARVLDAAKTEQAIYSIVGEAAKEFAAMAIEKKTTMAALERAAKQFAPKRGATKLKESIVATVDALGGLTRKPDTMPLGEFVAKEEPKRLDVDHDELDRTLKEAG